jgi:hypothetical protein
MPQCGMLKAFSDRRVAGHHVCVNTVLLLLLHLLLRLVR